MVYTFLAFFNHATVGFVHGPVLVHHFVPDQISSNAPPWVEVIFSEISQKQNQLPWNSVQKCHLHQDL